jgi:UDP-N-acetylmuramate dehydrogenase
MHLLEAFGERVKKNEPMSRHTTYRLGGPADFYLSVDGHDEAAMALAAARADGMPVLVLGGGSNILVADAGFRGLILSYSGRKVSIDGNRAVADGGAVLFSLVKSSADAGLAGLEWAAGIPGTVGGAVRGNAGAYGGEIKDRLEVVQAIDLGTGEPRTFLGSECGFSYRESFFKAKPWLITRAAFVLEPGDKGSLLETIKKTIELRRNKQPLEFGSAGSVFKSYVFGDEKSIPEAIRADVPPAFIGYGRIPAAWIIERLGLKGKKIGGAMISEKHANYFVNAGNATADEVCQLIGYAKMKVRDELGIQLQEEIEYVGFGN